MANRSDQGPKIVGGALRSRLADHTQVAAGDIVEYLDQCCRRTRRVVDVHIGRKHKYVMVQELFRTKAHKVPLALVVSVWRVCGSTSAVEVEGVDGQERT